MKIPEGLSLTIEIYPITKGINVPQSPNEPANSLIVNFLIFHFFLLFHLLD